MGQGRVILVTQCAVNHIKCGGVRSCYKITAETMINLLLFLSPGTFPLPDVILSNTPPPSPLRRARSCHAFFPEKTEMQPPSPLTPPATPGVVSDGDGGVQALQTGLSHIQEVRRRLRDSFSHNPLQLPQLSWTLPRHQRPQSSRGSAREEANSAPERTLRDEAEEVEQREEQQRWRLVGGELRMVADQFQRNRAKVSMNVTLRLISLPSSKSARHYTSSPWQPSSPSPPIPRVSEWAHVWVGGKGACTWR